MVALLPHHPSRVVVLGCSGSGKSTLAAVLAAKFDLPLVPSDHVYWREDWTPASEAEVQSWIEGAAAGDRWVIDGNFDAQRAILWERAQIAVWLDLPWTTAVGRVLRRNIGWWVSQKAVWGDKRMTLRRAWSGIIHAGRSHPRKRRAYPDALTSFPSLTVIRVQSTAELRTWIATL